MVREVQGIARHFENMEDPRSSVNQLHRLVDIIVIAVLGVLAGADGPLAIERWANAQEDWLKRYLLLPNGIPSRDTIGRVLQSLKPLAFQHCFAAWLTSLNESQSVAEADEEGEPRRQIALDGKCLRRSHDHGRGLGSNVPGKDRQINKCRLVGVTLVAHEPNRATKVTPTGTLSDSN